MTTTAAPPYVYIDTVKLPLMTTLSDALDIVEFLNGIGEAKFDPNIPGVAFSLTFEKDDGSEGDLWDVRETLHEIEAGLASRGINYHADRARLT